MLQKDILEKVMSIIKEKKYEMADSKKEKEIISSKVE